MSAYGMQYYGSMTQAKAAAVMFMLERCTEVKVVPDLRFIIIVIGHGQVWYLGR